MQFQNRVEFFMLSNSLLAWLVPDPGMAIIDNSAATDNTSTSKKIYVCERAEQASFGKFRV